MNIIYVILSIQNPVVFSYTIVIFFLFLPESCQVKFTKDTNNIKIKSEDAGFCNVITGFPSMQNIC